MVSEYTSPSTKARLSSWPLILEVSLEYFGKYVVVILVVDTKYDEILLSKSST